MQLSSAVWGWYQKDRVEVPVAGMVMVWDRLLSPRGSAPDARPNNAEPVPVCATAEATGALTPPVVQELSPDSKPPLTIPGTGAVGVTGAEAADGADVPTAFVAVTVNVYAVPLVSPVTVAVVEGGLPETVTGARAVPPVEGVTV